MIKSCVLIVVKLDSLDPDEEDDVLAALDGTAAKARELQEENASINLLQIRLFEIYRVLRPAPDVNLDARR